MWQPDGFGRELEILIPRSGMKMLGRVAPHEIGHAEVAIHFGGSVRGIALEPKNGGIVAQAIYEIPENLAVEDRCTIFAAGSAGEVLAYRVYGFEGAIGDRADIAALNPEADYDSLVEKAGTILRSRSERFDRLSHLLRRKLLYTDI
jgi:hypothetical protein